MHKRAILLVAGVMLLALTRSAFALSDEIITFQNAQTSTDTEQIEMLVANMQAAVLAQDAELYLSYVDLSDSNFATEHTNWVNDWAENDFLTDFSLTIDELEITDDVAVGTLTLTWETNLDHQPGATAIFPVGFHRTSEGWLYTGEYWVTTETEHFLVHAAPGLESTVEFLIPYLPDLYTGVTTDYGYEPIRDMEIKLYGSYEALWATVLMSLPPFSGWNEPSESLKLIGIDTQRLTLIVAHEFTHFLTFDQADHEQPLMPWWLNEGIAQATAQAFDTRGDQRYDDIVLSMQTLLLTDGLIEWELMANFEETSVDLWQYVYPQGYTFVRFVTEVYGREIRNEWLHLQTVEMDIYEATETVFEKTFDELNTEFEAWLMAFTPEN